MASLSSFISNINDGGLAKNNHFLASIYFPKALTGIQPFQSKAEKIAMFCDATQLPGLSYSTSQARSYGEFREIPYEKLYEPVTFSFYVDNKMVVKSFFDRWMESIQSPVTRDFSYPDQYITNAIEIILYDSQENSTYMVTLNKCYPKSVAPIQLDYASKDIMKLSVTMIYQNFTSSLMTTTQENFVAFEELKELKYGFEIPTSYFEDFNQFQDEIESYTSFFNGF